MTKNFKKPIQASLRIFILKKIRISCFFCIHRSQNSKLLEQMTPYRSEERRTHLKTKLIRIKDVFLISLWILNLNFQNQCELPSFLLVRCDRSFNINDFSICSNFVPPPKRKSEWNQTKNTEYQTFRSNAVALVAPGLRVSVSN